MKTRYISELVRWLREKPGPDVESASGSKSIALASRGLRRYGKEASNAMLRQIKANVSRIGIEIDSGVEANRLTCFPQPHRSMTSLGRAWHLVGMGGSSGMTMALGEVMASSALAWPSMSTLACPSSLPVSRSRRRTPAICLRARAVILLLEERLTAALMSRTNV